LPRIGITGHSTLSENTARRVADELRAILGSHQPKDLVGVTCLARGADQIFARVILELGGTIEVVLPAADYREHKVKPDNATELDDLVSRAATVHVMPLAVSNRAAYLAASDHVMDTVDELVAVWDGAAPDGAGGTGDVVRIARERGIRTTTVWPPGATRT
jgi:hypothetical protein